MERNEWKGMKERNEWKGVNGWMNDLALEETEECTLPLPVV